MKFFTGCVAAAALALAVTAAEAQVPNGIAGGATIAVSDFAGPYAFVGLSQVRESAIFSGIAIAERPASERCCDSGEVRAKRFQNPRVAPQSRARSRSRGLRTG